MSVKMENLNGYSTGTLKNNSVISSVNLFHEAGANIIELSALDESELDEVASALPLSRKLFERVSVHGPAKGRNMEAGELATKLNALDADVIMHPGSFGLTWVDLRRDLNEYRTLGSRLLIENNDARKPVGQTPGQLGQLLAQLPEAGVCLDVSHALDVGGIELLGTFVKVLGERIRQLHVGCATGHVAPDRIEEDVTALALDIQLKLGVPVIVERALKTSDVTFIQTQLAPFKGK